MGKEYPESELTNKIIGLAIKVHKNLGPGFTEKIYQRALEKEFIKNKINFKREIGVNVNYEGENIGLHIIDFLVEERIVVELKTVKQLVNVHIKQVISYLKASGKKIGLILNFSKDKLDIKRVIV